MTTQQMLDERYGRTSAARRRGWVIAISIVAAIGVALFAWMTVASAADDVSVDGTGFAIIDARTVTVDFQFTAPPGRGVACALEAQDEEHGIVGWRIVEFPASDEHARAFQEQIPTVAEATTGLVNSCWVA